MLHMSAAVKAAAAAASPEKVLAYAKTGILIQATSIYWNHYFKSRIQSGLRSERQAAL